MRSHSTTSRDEPNKLKGNPVAATMHAPHLGESNGSHGSKLNVWKPVISSLAMSRLDHAQPFDYVER